jgi:hypothetical protein
VDKEEKKEEEEEEEGGKRTKVRGRGVEKEKTGVRGRGG